MSLVSLEESFYLDDLHVCCEATHCSAVLLTALETVVRVHHETPYHKP